MRFTTVNRRTALAGGAGLSLAALLAACGGESDASSGSGTGAGASGSSRLPKAEGKTTYPMTIKTAYGETTLEKRPERIAVIGGFYEDEAVLDLGVRPVASCVNPKDTFPWITPHLDQLKGAVLLEPWSDASQAEKIASSKPDLIVAFAYSSLEKEFKKLKAIAPVLAFEKKQDAKGPTSVEDSMTLLGEALDLQSRASKALAKTAKAISDAKAEHPEWSGKTTSVLINYGPSMLGVVPVNGSNTPGETLLTGLGFAKHPHADALAKAGQSGISLEKLSLVDADAILLAQHGGRGKAEVAAKWLAGQKAWKQLGAVKKKKVTVIEPIKGKRPPSGLPVPWALGQPSTLGNRWLVDEFEKAYAKVL